MADKEEKEQQQAVNSLLEYVVKAMKEGKDKPAIVSGLIEAGMEEDAAREVVGAVYDKVAAQAQAESFTPAALVPGAIGGVLAALVGGGVWAAIAIAANAEIGFVAIGVGWLAGQGVVRLSGGKKGLPLQFLAVAAGILGILAGKYGTFYYYLKDYVAENHGAEAAASISPWAGNVLGGFVGALPEILGGYDALWALLAILAAWSVPKGLGIKAPQTAASVSMTPR